MAEGRKRDLWWHTAVLQATLININRKPDSPPIDPRKLHPLLPPEPEKKPSPAEVAQALKNAFL